MVRALNQVSAFKYVTAENAPTYRAIMQIFFEARQRYVIELRPEEVLERLRGSGLFFTLPTDDTLEYHLSHLVEWGNLAAAHDPGAVTRLEDFYRKRLLYHLTAVGEAAHRAVLEVEATAGRSGSLQSTMLAKIRDALRALADAAAAPSPSPDALLRLLHDLHTAFDTLTEEANRFIGELDRSMAADRVEEERFVLYKQALLAYISRFVDQLRRLADEIRAGIEAVEAAGEGRLLELASCSADLPPSLGGDDPVVPWVNEQRARWAGVRAWFVGDPASSSRPTVERLAEVARDAVVSLTRTLGRLNDRRTRPVDRAADFRTLARWFTACPDDRAAHALWHAAFGLAPARHFHLQEEDPELVAPSTSWWDAPPVEVPVRLRTHGKTSTAGRPSAAADHALTRQWIAQKRRRERAQLQEAERRFAGRGLLSIRALATLDAAEFALLLSLIDEALAAPRGADGTRAARTADGRLLVTLVPPPPGETELVPLDTPSGRLWCLDYRLEVTDVLAGASPRAAAGGDS
ncbi:MAG TPA: TIGR02677 family protein [Myxococcaceae bacterium]|nr:TIGR02677 family protein [Myxococcaceae bacterium]